LQHSHDSEHILHGFFASGELRQALGYALFANRLKRRMDLDCSRSSDRFAINLSMLGGSSEEFAYPNITELSIYFQLIVHFLSLRTNMMPPINWGLKKNIQPVWMAKPILGESLCSGIRCKISGLIGRRKLACAGHSFLCTTPH
jgi:hypothetical protein